MKTRLFCKQRVYTSEIANLLLKVSWVASQIALYRGDIALNRAELAERFTRAILKLNFRATKIALSYDDINRLCKRALRGPSLHVSRATRLPHCPINIG